MAKSRSLDDLINDLIIRYTAEVNGEYFRDSSGGYSMADTVTVLTRVDSWMVVVLEGTVFAEAGGNFHMSSRYKAVDGFELKVELRRRLHRFFGRVFGSRDTDIGEHELNAYYSVESNDEEKVRTLLSDEKFRTLWSRCMADRRPYDVIDRFRVSISSEDATGRVDVRIPYYGIELPKRPKNLPLEPLIAIHDLVVETLRKLADMGSASREQVEIPPLGKGGRRVKQT